MSQPAPWVPPAARRVRARDVAVVQGVLGACLPLEGVDERGLGAGALAAGCPRENRGEEGGGVREN